VKRLSVLIIIMGMLVLVAGCDRISWQTTAKEPGADLLYVQICFDNGEKLNTYVKEMGIGQDSTVYAGGITDSNMYDARGNLVGRYNYTRVNYMTVVAPAPQ